MSPIPKLVPALKLEILAQEGEAAEALEHLAALIEQSSEGGRQTGEPHFELVGRNLVFRRG